MKLTILSENIQQKLPFINRAVSLKTQLPILLNLLLKTKKGKLQISSTDLEIGIQTLIPANIQEEGATLIPAKTFIELINSLPSGKINLQVKNKILEVSTTKIKSTFQTEDWQDYPKLFEEKGEEIIKLKKETFQKDFSKVVFAASTDTTRPALSGIYVEKNQLVATDGYRLSLKRNKNATEKPLLIPARVIREVAALKEEEDMVGIFIAEQKNQVLFEQGDTIIVGRLIDAQFPSYEKIIPSEFSTKVLFDREDLQKAVKICAIFAREAANIVRFSIKKNTIIVSANSPQVGENTVEVEAKVTGDENEIAFNARYLIEFLGNIEEEELVFEMTTPTSPGVFKIKDDPSFLHLIMPIRVQNEA